MYKKLVLYEFKNTNIFTKITIKNEDIICDYDIIKKDLEQKIKKIQKIYFMEFYVSLCDYEIIKQTEYWKTIKNISLNEFPIYKKSMDFSEFIEFYLKQFNNNTARVYETMKMTKRKYIFNTQEECLKTVIYSQTNPKFENFNQLFFHAGDNYDMERYGYLYIRSLFNNNSNYQTIPFIPIWDKFNTNFLSIKNTFHYLFNKMKKGVLVGIQNNKLVLFLPFSKHNYTNDFYEELYFDENDKKMLKEYKNSKNKNLFEKLKKTVIYYSKKYHLKNVNPDRTKWIANDCFFRTETYEGDKSEAMYEDFFTNLCENRKINDCIFFLNLRDHPVLNKDLKDSYTSIIDKKLDEKYIHKEYCPILSVGCSYENADIPLITQDDWSRVSKKYYPDDCNNGYFNEVKPIKWEDKIPKAQFRGSATGCGVDEMTNMRIKATYISNKFPDLLDAGIVKFNRKLKKSLNEPLKLIDLNIQTKNFMTLEEKMKYKYILNIDGHVSAYRLGHELSLNSVVLIPQTKYYLWFSHLLKPYEHFIPIKENLEDLIEKIIWCRDNDEKCKKIAENAKLFYNKYLGKDGIFNYMQQLLNSISYKSLGFKKYNMRLGIITIYRNDLQNTRLMQKRYFLYFMNKILKQLCDYDIIIVEQNQGDKFNIGKLKNIGFEYLNKKNKYDNYIFTDIDTIPDSNLIEYFFKITDSINALATFGTRYSTDIKLPFVGACFSCTKEVYEKINGFSNIFWGWAGEDVNLLFRIRDNNMPLYRNNKGKVLDFEEINFKQKDLKTKVDEEIDREDMEYEKNFNYKNYKIDGLNSLDYTILDEINYENNYHIIVNLNYKKSLEMYPKLYKYDISVSKDEYKKLKREFLYEIKLIDF